MRCGCGYGMMRRKRPAQEIEGARSFIHPYCLVFYMGLDYTGSRNSGNGKKKQKKTGDGCDNKDRIN